MAITVNPNPIILLWNEVVSQFLEPFQILFKFLISCHIQKGNYTWSPLLTFFFKYFNCFSFFNWFWILHLLFLFCKEFVELLYTFKKAFTLITFNDPRSIVLIFILFIIYYVGKCRRNIPSWLICFNRVWKSHEFKESRVSTHYVESLNKQCR